MKKIVKNIISVIVALALFLAIAEGLRYLLFDDTKTDARLVFHEIYTMKDNIDTAIVGSSHVYRSLDPRVADEYLQENTFDLATSGQRIDGSFAILKEACKYHDIKHVYLEMYNHIIWDSTSFSDRVEIVSTYEVSDYMRFSADKVSLLLESSAPKYYSNNFIVARRNWEQLFDTEYITDLYERKHTDAYLNYELQRNKAYYVGKGYYPSKRVLKDTPSWKTLTSGYVYAIDNITGESDWRKNMLRIIDFCSKKGIELTLFIVPEPDYEVLSKQNYQEFIDVMQALADEHGLEFYDFNLVKREYFDTGDCSLFMDENHMNDKGAAIFSDIFGKFFSGQISQEELFYKNIEEKRAAVEPKVYGLAMFWPVPEGYAVPFVVASHNKGIEYKIELTPKETGQTWLYQDFDENIMIWLTEGEETDIKVTWRVSGQDEEHEFQLTYPE